MSRTCVFEWHKWFHEGRTDVEDDEHSRCLTISKSTNNIREIEKIVRKDCRLSIRLIAKRMSIDKEMMWQVLHDNLHMTKVCAQIVSKVSTSDQKEKTPRDLRWHFKTNWRKLKIFRQCDHCTCDKRWIFLCSRIQKAFQLPLSTSPVC